MSEDVSDERTFVSRGGLKLDAALDAFDLDVTDLVCADFGCNVGGFADCLLQRGAATVYAVDTGYGALAWKLRRDERVVVMERTNALHAESPEAGVDLVVIDMGWTPQRHAIPAALKWLRPGGTIISLVKPHYEIDDAERKANLVEGRLDDAFAEEVMQRVLAQLPALGVEPKDHVKSPITGGKAKNVEYLVLARKA